MPNRKSPRRVLIDLECQTLSDRQLLKLEAVVKAVGDSPPPVRRAWTEVLLDRILIIGGVIDQAVGTNNRRLWLLIVSLGVLVSVHVTWAGDWKVEYVVHGLLMLVVLFLMGVLAGLLTELWRLRHRGRDVQVTVLTGINSESHA